MQYEPQSSVQHNRWKIRFTNGESGELVWVLEDLLDEKPPHSYSLAPWMNRNSDQIQYVCPVVCENVPNHLSPKDSHASGPPAQLIPDGVITHPVLVEELFFELSDGSRITRKRVTELIVHGSQG